MKSPLAVALFLVSLRTLSASPQDYFVSCDDALQTAPFSALRKQIETESSIQQLDQCMRLSNKEFLVTGNPRGPFNGDPSNFFYCNAEMAPPTCVADKSYAYYPSLGIIRQFSGRNNKQYVLWSTYLLRHGVETSGYGIFSLVPKTQDPRGYEIYTLPVGTYCSYSEERDCACDNLPSATKESIRVTDPQILNEGQSSVSIVFKTITTDCSNFRNASRTVALVLKDGRFVAK